MIRFPVFVVLAAGLAGQVRADDWPMFGRDRTHNAVSPEAGAPTDWQAELRDYKTGAVTAPARNIRWSARLGSRNIGGPVVAGGLVWVGTNNARPRDPADFRLRKDGGKEPIDKAVLMCFRESDGKFLWQYTSARLPEMINDGPEHAMGSTPLVEGDRLYVITNRCEALCFDVGPLRRGEGPPTEVWRVDMMKRFGVFPHAMLMAAGFSPSPAADADRLYVVTGNGVGEDYQTVPAPDAPSLVCLDKRTGKLLWADASPGKNILQGQRSSPLVIDVAGRTQVVVGQGDGWLRAFDAATGRLVWKCDLNPKAAKYRPGKGRRNHVMATPVLYEGRVYIAPGRDPENGPGENEVYCVDPTGTGDVSVELDDGPGKGKPNPNSRVVWRYGGPAPKGAEREYLFGRTLANCVARDGLVYACDSDGFLHCLDATTGKLVWDHDLKATAWGGPLWAAGRLYIATEDGDVVIFAHGREKKHVATIDMGAPVDATPVYSNGTLYVMTSRALYAIPGRP